VFLLGFEAQFVYKHLARLESARDPLPWRDLPEKHGKWMTVYHRFRRWSEAGIWEAVATTLATTPRVDWASLMRRTFDADVLCLTSPFRCATILSADRGPAGEPSRRLG
jgi:transposase